MNLRRARRLSRNSRFLFSRIRSPDWEERSPPTRSGSSKSQSVSLNISENARPPGDRELAAQHLLIGVAERIDGEIADEAIIAELHELRDRAHAALGQFSEQS